MSGNDTANPWGSLLGVRPVKRVVDMRKRGKTEETIHRELKDLFDISDEKIALALLIADKEISLTQSLTLRDAAIYIDIPFCPSKCAYCAFASVGAEQTKQYAEPYLAALYHELETGSRIVKDLGFTIRSVYIGGGTPTTLMEFELDNLLYKISQCFDLSSACEFTVEAGRPDTITMGKLEAMRKRGVTRVSINPQTIHEKTLKRIGRRHTPQAVFDAVTMAKSLDFPVLNMDVIAGLPGETTEEFMESLKVVSDLKPENLTVHTMSIKRASRLKEEAYSPDDEEHIAAAEMLAFAYPFLAEKGYEAYYLYRQKNTLGNLENTGFSLPGHECLYNIGMMQEIMPVFGFGMGAVTKILKPGRLERIFNVNDLLEYLRRSDEMCQRKEYMYQFYKNVF